MGENKISEIMETAMEKIKAMVDADTIIGNPIEMNGVTILPVSKISFGIASGGADFDGKNNGSKVFGGGGGAGVSVAPVAFLAVKGEDVKLLQIYQNSSAADKAIAMVPEVFDKIKSLFQSKKEPSSEE